MVLAFTVATLGEAVFGAEPAATSPPSKLAVVRTWGELLDQPAIKLSTGGEVRLGVSVLESRPATAITIYCATRDSADASGRVQGKLLGPLQLSVRMPGSTSVESDLRQRLAPSYRRQEWRLYAAPVELNNLGDYVAALSLPGGPSLAEATLRCNGKPYHVWMPWGTPNEMRVLAERKDGFSDEGRVGNDCGPAAMPSTYGAVPIALIDADELKKNEKAIRRWPLPTLLPDETDMALTLRVVGNELWVNARDKLPFDSPDENLLVRWWINGSPVAPCPAAIPRLIERARLRKLNVGPLRAYFHMEFNPAKIGAKSQDRVALQLLYTRCGWQPLNGKHVEMATDIPSGMMPLTLLSNRVEWTVP